jgi:hypothetical protein
MSPTNNWQRFIKNIIPEVDLFKDSGELNRERDFRSIKVNNSFIFTKQFLYFSGMWKIFAPFEEKANVYQISEAS